MPRPSYREQLTLGCILAAAIYVLYAAWVGASGLWEWVAAVWKSL